MRALGAVSCWGKEKLVGGFALMWTDRSGSRGEAWGPAEDEDILAHSHL